VLDYYPRRSRLSFQVDLFQGYGQLPRNLEEVSEREKDIRYSSRTRVSTDVFQQKHEVRHAINELHEMLPEEIRRTEQAKRLYAFGCVTEMDIVQLIYRPLEPQGASKDYEFSRSAMNTRWGQGMSDASSTLRAAPWLAPKPREVGVRVFDVMHDVLVGRAQAQTEAKPTDGDRTDTRPTKGRLSEERLVKQKPASEEPKSVDNLREKAGTMARRG